MSEVGKPKAQPRSEGLGQQPRWKGITRTYTAEDVVALQGTVVEEHTLARRGAEGAVEAAARDGVRQLSRCAHRQHGRAAGPRGSQGHLPVGLAGCRRREPFRPPYPDQSLYPANSVPQIVRRINNALLRADEIAAIEGDKSVENWLAPIVADGEAGFGGALNVYELQKAMIAAGVAGSHWEDQLASRRSAATWVAGAHPDPAAHPHPDFGSPGGGRRECPDGRHRTHRRRGGDAHHLRCRRP